METKTKSITTINKEITRELADPNIGRALLATTFKGLSEQSMKQAIFEGVTRGFTFKDFLEKNVYAIPYGQGYSLITSIDYARKIGMKSGVIGKSAPVFEMDEKKLVSCTITIKRRVGQDIAEFTATVYFDEYSTGKNLWNSKPRTMLAKVAESHAMRMACPEELSQTYTVEEMEKETDSETYDTEPIAENAIIISTGDDTRGIESHAEFVMPKELGEQKKMILGLVVTKDSKVDLKNKGELKQWIEDYTQLAYTEENYPAIINYLR